MKKELSQAFSFLISGSFLLLAAVILFVDARFYEEAQYERLETMALTVREAWRKDQDYVQVARTLEQNAHQSGIPAYILLLVRDGSILYGENGPLHRQANPVRQEFKLLFQGEAQDMRLKQYEQGHKKFAHYSLAVPDKSAVIRVSASWELPFSHYLKILLPLLVILPLTIFLLHHVVKDKTSRYIRTLKELEGELVKLEAGDYTVRVSEISGSPYHELRTLSAQFNKTGVALEKRYEYNKARMARLSTILNTMIDPLLMVNKEKNLLYINQQAMQVFGREIDPEEYSYPQILLTHSEELDWLIEESMNSSSDIDTHISIPTVEGKTKYKALISPIFMEGEAFGVVVALHDLTVEEEAAAFRRDFIANVTHELKTPLTSIRGFIETLRNGNIPETQMERFLDIISVEAERLEHLIDDILSLSETERGKLKEISSFDLAALIDEVIVLLDEQASQKHVSVYTEDSLPLVLEVKAERDRLKQVLINLIDNAIKYNHEGGRVSVNAYRLANGKVQIVVQDNGPGISKEAQKRIFERFYRVDTGRSRSLGGTGLGLSIVKHIAQLYSGTAEVESLPGEGSRFIITLQI